MKIRFGHTPDTDDAFHYFALETGLLPPPPGMEFEFLPLHIQRLNEMALEGKLEVTAISSVLYPLIEKDYVILASGSSVGRNYGPVLAVKKGRSLTDLAGKKVAVPGRHTTGYFLLDYFYSGFTPEFMEFDRVAEAVSSGEADAGVLIHEELLNYAQRGLDKMACLGGRWYEATGLPLPVGLTVARRDLGAQPIAHLRSLLASSMREAMRRPEEAMKHASAYSSGKGVTGDFVAKFANRDTEDMPEDVRLGLAELFRRARLKGLIAREPELEIA